MLRPLHLLGGTHRLARPAQAPGIGPPTVIDPQAIANEAPAGGKAGGQGRAGSQGQKISRYRERSQPIRAAQRRHALSFGCAVEGGDSEEVICMAQSLLSGPFSPRTQAAQPTRPAGPATWADRIKAWVLGEKGPTATRETEPCRSASSLSPPRPRRRRGRAQCGAAAGRRFVSDRLGRSRPLPFPVEEPRCPPPPSPSPTSATRPTPQRWPPAFPPAGASAWGDDQYGLWIEVVIGGPVQRLRWIEPGEFLMGSPGGEVERSGNEGPQHVVRL